MSIVPLLRNALVTSALLLAAAADADGKDACKANIVKFCDEVLPGGGRILNPAVKTPCHKVKRTTLFPWLA